jgi:hypothetical protein
MPTYQPGQIVDGYKFNGGDYKDQKNWTELTGPALLKSLPAQDQSLVHGMVNYDIPPGSLRGSIGSPQVQRLLSLAARVDPHFSAGDYANRNAVKKNFTSGKNSDTITAFNTTIDHLGSLYDDSLALNNHGGLATPLNAIGNFVEPMVGDARVGNFNNDKKAVAAESVKAFTGGQGAEADRQNQEANYNANAAPNQQLEAILHTTNLLKSKLHEMGVTYERGIPGHSVMELLSPSARATLDRLTKIQQQGQQPSQPSSSAAPKASGKVRVYNPATGELE